MISRVSQTDLLARHFKALGDDTDHALELFVTDRDAEIAVIETGSNGCPVYTVLLVIAGSDETFCSFTEDFTCKQRAVFEALARAATEYAGMNDDDVTRVNIAKHLGADAIM